MTSSTQVLALAMTALLALAWLVACDEDDETEQQLQPRACKCCDYADGICSAACECDPSEQCSLLLPSGETKSYGTYTACFAKMTVYCNDSLLFGVEIQACTIAVDAAECAETEDGDSFPVPSQCFD